MAAPWVIPSGSHRPARTCRRCARTFSPAELRTSGPGWSPLRDGWRCPDCTRVYEARIERLAHRLIAEHEHREWMHVPEHTTSAECVFCDVIRRATALLLECDSRRPESAETILHDQGPQAPDTTPTRSSSNP